MEEEKKLILEKYKDDIIDWISDIAKAVNILDNSASYLKSKKNTIKFLKTREVKSPTRAFEFDAGIDFYVPEFTPEFVKILKEKNPDLYISVSSEDSAFDSCVVLEPGERVLIPSGIHCQMQTPNRMLAAFNKSGIASKFGLVAGAAIVDSSYQGEIHLSLINTSNAFVKITPGMKILQFIEIPIYCSKILVEENKTISEFYGKETERGAGGFGSSDK